jgi:hypothetical protein
MENLIEKKTTYTPAHREAQQRYREKNRDDYNRLQRELYSRLRENEEWKKKFNERSAKNNLVYRDKKRIALMEDPNYVVRGRGRPRKTEKTTL